MCLIVFSWQVITNHPFIAVANRDEYYSRPSAPAMWWEDHPQVFAPRDLQAGGTWMGAARLGYAGHKFAALTNVRDGSKVLEQAPSRGKLVSDYLTGTADPKTYVQQLADSADLYNGFNLLVGELSEVRQELRWFSNRNTDNPKNGQLLTPGIYGISNGALDASWPKVSKTKAELASLLCQCAPQEAYFEMLSNTLPAPDHRLPDTGVSLEMERLLSSVCIKSEHYGTRSSSLMKLNSQFEMKYDERVLR
jgi:uncharacterized protein with NRDE domain